MIIPDLSKVLYATRDLSYSVHVARRIIMSIKYSIYEDSVVMVMGT